MPRAECQAFFAQKSLSAAGAKSSECRHLAAEDSPRREITSKPRPYKPFPLPSIIHDLFFRGAESTPPTHALHFYFSIGTVRPFSTIFHSSFFSMHCRNAAVRPKGLQKHAKIRGQVQSPVPTDCIRPHDIALLRAEEVALVFKHQQHADRRRQQEQ